jgi:hypothetical protein
MNEISWHSSGTDGNWFECLIFSFNLNGKNGWPYGRRAFSIGLLIRGSTVRARLGPLLREITLGSTPDHPTTSRD